MTEKDPINDKEIMTAINTFLDVFLLDLTWPEPNDDSRLAARRLVDKMKRVGAELEAYHLISSNLPDSFLPKSQPE